METVNENLTTHQAKNLVRQYAEANGLEFSKLSARTVGFSSLGVECVFVNVKGWTPGPGWKGLKQFAVKQGFRVDFDPVEVDGVLHIGG